MVLYALRIYVCIQLQCHCWKATKRASFYDFEIYDSYGFMFKFMVKIPMEFAYVSYLKNLLHLTRPCLTMPHHASCDIYYGISSISNSWVNNENRHRFTNKIIINIIANFVMCRPMLDFPLVNVFLLDENPHGERRIMTKYVLAANHGF